MATSENNKSAKILILSVSVLVTLAVAALMLLPKTFPNIGASWQPALHAALNSGVFLCLISALWAIKNRKEQLHRNLMSLALVFSAVFLISYVIYHFGAESVIFGDADKNGLLSDAERETVGSLRPVYLLILLTHIVSAALVLPPVLFSFYFALSGQIGRHKKMVKWAFPFWLYVAGTGVLTYLLVQPYYP